MIENQAYNEEPRQTFLQKKGYQSTQTVNSKFSVYCLLLTSTMLPLLVGYHFALVNPIIPSLKQMYNETYLNRYHTPMPEATWLVLLTVSVSSVVIGAFIGGTTTKLMLNFVSSKHLNQLGHILNIVAIMISSLIGGYLRSYEAFIIGRLVAGIPCGLTFNLAPLLVAELSERRKQGLWQSLVGVSISFGFLIAAILAHPLIFGSASMWPVLISLGMIPSVIYLICSINIAETPYYYIRLKKKEEALKTLKKLRYGKEDAIKYEIELIEKEMGSTKAIGILEILKTKQYRNQLIAVSALFANLMLCGVNNIIFYSDRIFSQAGISSSNVTFATIGIFAFQFIMACIGSKFVDRFGGLKVTIGGSVGFIVSLLLFTISQAMLNQSMQLVTSNVMQTNTTDLALSPTNLYREEDVLNNTVLTTTVISIPSENMFQKTTISHISTTSNNHNVWPYISVVAVGIFMISWSGGTHISTFALLGELTIEPTRATCLSYGNAVMWITSWIVSFVPPYLQEALGPYSMVIWLLFTVLFLVYMIIFLPDTKGKTSEEIQALLGRKPNAGSSNGKNVFLNDHIHL